MRYCPYRGATVGGEQPARAEAAAAERIGTAGRTPVRTAFPVQGATQRDEGNVRICVYSNCNNDEIQLYNALG